MMALHLRQQILRRIIMAWRRCNLQVYDARFKSIFDRLYASKYKVRCPALHLPHQPVPIGYSWFP